MINFKIIKVKKCNLLSQVSIKNKAININIDNFYSNVNTSHSNLSCTVVYSGSFRCTKVVLSVYIWMVLLFQ